jgi:hypothetical protein
MALSYSMIVLPCFHTYHFFFFLYRSDAIIHNSSEGSSYASEGRSVSMRMSNSSAEKSIYESDLETLLSTEYGIKKFSEHCAKEFSMENIRFWQSVNHFRTEVIKLESTPLESIGEASGTQEVSQSEDGGETTPDATPAATPTAAALTANQQQTKDDIYEMAIAIWDEYVKPGSDMQVNIPNKMCKEVKATIDSHQLGHDLFDDSQREIFNLMSRDSYQRYLASKARESSSKQRKNSVKLVGFARRRSLSGDSGGSRSSSS